MYNPLKVKSYYLLAALWIISSFANLSYAEPIYINELYSKSQGNNKYEAKIKAIDKSMTRAVILIADKMGFISGDNIASFRKIPAGKLRSIFNKMTIKNENTEEYPSGAKYSSIISFECESANLYELLKEYRNKGEKYNSPTLLIPIFKINKILYLDNDASGWIKEWIASKTKLLDYNVVILQGPQYEQHDITGKNILSLNFKDLASRTPERIFDRVILSIGEFFTDKISGETLFSVEHITLTYSKKDAKKVTYKLNSAKNSFLELKKSIVSQFILDLGAPSAKKEEIPPLTMSELGINDAQSEGADESQSYSFQIQTHYEDEMTKISQKLVSIPEIKSFNITTAYNKTQNITLYTDLDIAKLTEKLYDQHLSFFYDDDRNPVLINIDN